MGRRQLSTAAGLHHSGHEPQHRGGEDHVGPVAAIGHHFHPRDRAESPHDGPGTVGGCPDLVRAGRVEMPMPARDREHPEIMPAAGGGFIQFNPPAPPVLGLKVDGHQLPPSFPAASPSVNHANTICPGRDRRRWSLSRCRRAVLHRSFAGGRRRVGLLGIGRSPFLRDEGQQIGTSHVAAFAASVDLQPAAARGPESMNTPAHAGGGLIQTIKSIEQNRPGNRGPGAATRWLLVRSTHVGSPSDGARVGLPRLPPLVTAPGRRKSGRRPGAGPLCRLGWAGA